MSKDTTVRIGILGALREQGPMTIKQVRNLLQRYFGDYWTFGYGVIKPSCQRFSSEGWITRHPITEYQETASTTKDKFSITERGEQELRELLRARVGGIENPQRRHIFIIRMAFIQHLPVSERQEKIQEIIKRFRDVRQKRQRLYELHSDVSATLADTKNIKIELIKLSVTLIDQIISWLEDFERSISTQDQT